MKYLLLFLLSVVYSKITKVNVLYDDEKNIIFHNNAIFSQTDVPVLIEDQDFHELIFNIIIIVSLTLFGGVMSGLTVGYLSIDDLILELKANTGSDKEKGYAAKIIPVISKRHWLLVTLLLCNAVAMEALPIFLDKVVDEYVAIAISVSLVLIFGEILPQAVCTGRSQLRIASLLSPLTFGLMYLSFPISYPISLFLDWLLGKHSKSRFCNTELKNLIELHTSEALNKLNIDGDGDDEQGLLNEQANLMISAIEIKEKLAVEMMIPIDEVFMLDYNQFINERMLHVILDKGFSRIPVYLNDKHNIIGILRLKQLIGRDFTIPKSLKEIGIKLKPPLVFDPKTNAIDLLREFKKGKSHMAYITDHVHDLNRKFVELGVSVSLEDTFLETGGNNDQIVIHGVVTFRDMIEKMVNIEIKDEDDYAKSKPVFSNKKNISNIFFIKKKLSLQKLRRVLLMNKALLVLY
jgi:metal transporter CNNM